MKQKSQTRKLYHKLLSGGVTLLLVAAVCLSLYIAVQVLTHGHMSLGGYSCFRVITGSMEPELSVNDMVIVTARDAYEVGDVVVFQSYGSLVVHRIVSIDGESVITQGDANDTPDPAIKLSDIKGEVVTAIPYVGLILSFIRSPLGIILILGTAFFLMERSFRKEKEESLDELEQIKEEIRRLQAQQEAQDQPKD
jgi:signal peptidase